MVPGFHVLGTYVSFEDPLYSGVIACREEAAKLLKSPDITLIPFGLNISSLTSLIYGILAPKCSLISGLTNLFLDSGATFFNNPLVGPPGHVFGASPYAQLFNLLKQ